jgi:adenylate cyclase
MTPKEIKSFKNSEEYYEMSGLSWESLSKLEEDNSEKVYIVDNGRMELMKQCNTLRDECLENDAKFLNYMGAVDNAMDTEGVEEESERYYGIILGSYEELSI